MIDIFPFIQILNPMLPLTCRFYYRTARRVLFWCWADTASRTCLPAGRAEASQNLFDDSQEWKIIYLQVLRTGKEIRFRFWLSEDKAGKEAKRRPTGW